MVYMVYCLNLVLMSWYSCCMICIVYFSLWSCISNRFNSALSLLTLAALYLRHYAFTGKPGYFSSHLSFICFINPLPLLLSSLSIFNSSSFISFVHSLLVIAGVAVLVYHLLLDFISCVGFVHSNLNLPALYLGFCVDMLFSLIRFINLLPLPVSSLPVSTSHSFSSPV